MKDFITLLNQYPKLSESKVSISSLGVAHRVFFNWKEKGLIDYEHNFTQEDLDNNVTRKKIKLNAFEALWILIIKELRSFNIGLDTIGKLKTFLFTVPNYNFIKDLSKTELKEISEHMLNQGMNSFLSAFDLNVETQIDHLNNLTDSNKIYYSNLSILINVILLSGQAPSLFIFKKPVEEELGFEIFNPTLEFKYYSQINEDYRSHLINGLIEHSVINIPIRPLFEHFFDNKLLIKYAIDFNLYTDGELKILKLLKSKDFNKIIIHKNNDQQITIESTSSEQVLGNKAIELRRTLGLKQYERAEIIHRNDKHLVITNTTKQKIDLGNT
ncbi:hypothetical protein KFZ70_02610 [Tamlana fucoidanivorans]|uniref:Uncharacterized protein n=1 Tax=Allotamlana fucoidanivorans TaxID=2583814 RepID=A0A5C4SEB1_9FLAO|nr:hypothetical protein [Tamlana fucoidanivorans]TNJ41876.1 hypothetical protein FGF67_15040 [Tamlana fucoidanivorans]